jgi:WhiB family redox-sensing transcriptional regulator
VLSFRVGAALLAVGGVGVLVLLEHVTAQPRSPLAELSQDPSLTAPSTVPRGLRSGSPGPALEIHAIGKPVKQCPPVSQRLQSLTEVPGGTKFACVTQPDLFFAESPADIARAKELCRGCPAAAACLASALDRGEPWGVWGGELVLRGEVIASKRGRGRPRQRPGLGG